MKYSIILPYYKKGGYIDNTLLSYSHWYGDRKDFEVIIIEDIKNANDKNDHQDLLRAVVKYKHNLNIRVIRHNVQSWNPSTHFNHGVREAKGEYVILSNPECFHTVDVLKGFDVEFDKRKDIYVLAGCKFFDVGLFDNFNILLSSVNRTKLNNTDFIDPNIHWCSTMTKQNYLDLGGFDEIYSEGYYAEDNDWMFVVRYSKVQEIHRPDLLVIHQNHPKLRPPEPSHSQMAERNRRILRLRWKEWKW